MFLQVTIMYKMKPDIEILYRVELLHDYGMMKGQFINLDTISNLGISVLLDINY